ncbi:hypothetical protein K469DRAFT_681922 [Zopfia rhizophila CBS 207.26]|uniref:Uncharacterized protein n=1 Tax=Zopfia rhizophila CBS 207.26 TaxID=1314779 RepID=A0A6A6EVR4_9PEZI|nr:hypothetical protein K469DRAFT_681922 [Zopfia rhizophila CBS 207.26]
MPLVMHFFAAFFFFAHSSTFGSPVDKGETDASLDLASRSAWTLEAAPVLRAENFLPKTDAKCGDTIFNNDADRYRIWAHSLPLDETGAGALALAFIRAKGHDHWVQNLFATIFLDKSATTFDCTNMQAQCGPVPDCSEFEEKGYTSGFYLSQSPTNIHAWLSKLKDEALAATVKEILAID